MSWKTLLESVSGSLNDHLQLRAEYLMAENRILRNQIVGRVRLTDTERKELAELGAKLGKTTLREIATIATPDTILSWNRKLANLPVVASKPLGSVGRPRIDPEIEAQVLRMARENRSWGYDRIQGSLNHLGYKISDQTVGNILKRNGISPSPERKKALTWREFTRSHLNVLLATDFFNAEVWSWFGFLTSYLLCFLHFSSNLVHSVGMSLNNPVRRMLSLVPRALDLNVVFEKTRRFVKTIMCPWRVSFGRSLQQQVFSELPCDDLREGQPQGRSHIVFLSSVKPRPIRDGPVQRRQQLNTFLKDDDERQSA